MEAVIPLMLEYIHNIIQFTRTVQFQTVNLYNNNV